MTVRSYCLVAVGLRLIEGVVCWLDGELLLLETSEEYKLRIHELSDVAI